MTYERGQFVVTSLSEGITARTRGEAVQLAKEGVEKIGQVAYILQVIGVVRMEPAIDLDETPKGGAPAKRHPVSRPGTCRACGEEFKSQQGLSRHRKISHQHPCVDCRSWFDSVDDLRDHRVKAHPSPVMVVGLPLDGTRGEYEYEGQGGDAA